MTTPHTTSTSELVIGLVGAIGTDLETVATRVCSLLGDTFAYTCTKVNVSELLTRVAWPEDRNLDASRWADRTRARMDAGRDLCRSWSAHDALAQLAILRIAAERSQLGSANGEPLHRHAFVLKSLKRPAEVEYLRAVYGNRFVLIGAYTPRPKRRDALLDKLERDFETRNEQQIRMFGVDVDRDLLGRDEREDGEGGQNVRGTFHQADVFVETHTGLLDVQLTRGMRILFGDPRESPTKVEAAMSHADRAARRSVEPGRQVGAAVMTDRGDVLTVGCNEVPRAFGGQYWGDDEQPRDGEPVADAREVLNRLDTNNKEQADIAADVIGRLRDHLRPEALTDEAALGTQVLRSRLGETTEFGRAVHAEMAAITTAARLGIPLAGTTLLTDTFPCHNCARHIVATGIRRVVYVAPYAKSRAHELHRDAIAVAPAEDGEGRGKVIFEPFIGVAPRRFEQWFAGLKRKDDDGRILPYEPKSAIPRVGNATDQAAALEVVATTARESLANINVVRRLAALHPKLTEMTHAPTR